MESMDLLPLDLLLYHQILPAVQTLTLRVSIHCVAHLFELAFDSFLVKLVRDL